jgi:hypothetical protein
VRLGLPATQWITVYNAHRPMKQRCVRLRLGLARAPPTAAPPTTAPPAAAPPAAAPGAAWSLAAGGNRLGPCPAWLAPALAPPSSHHASRLLGCAHLSPPPACPTDVGAPQAPPADRLHPPTHPPAPPTHTRYHYNVANTRVDQHVEKGNDDGLYISSVACCQELWALIMDAGTGFTAQVRCATLHGPAPPPARAGLVVQPGAGSRACAASPCAACTLRPAPPPQPPGARRPCPPALPHGAGRRRAPPAPCWRWWWRGGCVEGGGVATSGRCAAQVYSLTAQFLPKEWIMEKWEEGFYITAMAGSMSGSSLVVMSKGTPYTQQSYKVRAAAGGPAPAGQRAPLPAQAPAPHRPQLPHCPRPGRPRARAGLRLVPLQVDKQEVEGGLLRDLHVHQPHALGRGHEPQRRLRGPGARAARRRARAGCAPRRAASKATTP